jgi:hypothetical protein
VLLSKGNEMGRLAGVGGLVATDRVFGLLAREFEVRDVREAVANPARLISMRVEYPRPHEPWAVPDEFVEYAIAQFRVNLELAIALEHEFGNGVAPYLQATRSEDEGVELTEDSYGVSGLVILFQNLMGRLTQLNHRAAHAEAMSWPIEDEHIFVRLRIWAAGQRYLLNAHEAAQVFMALPDRVFWGPEHERDLLYALRDRWSDFSAEDRAALETRLLTSSYPWSDDG